MIIFSESFPDEILINILGVVLANQTNLDEISLVTCKFYNRFQNIKNIIASDILSTYYKINKNLETNPEYYLILLKLKYKYKPLLENFALRGEYLNVQTINVIKGHTILQYNEQINPFNAALMWALYYGDKDIFYFILSLDDYYHINMYISLYEYYFFRFKYNDLYDFEGNYFGKRYNYNNKLDPNGSYMKNSEPILEINDKGYYSIVGIAVYNGHFDIFDFYMFSKSNKGLINHDIEKTIEILDNINFDRVISCHCYENYENSINSAINITKILDILEKYNMFEFNETIRDSTKYLALINTLARLANSCCRNKNVFVRLINLRNKFTNYEIELESRILSCVVRESDLDYFNCLIEMQNEKKICIDFIAEIKFGHYRSLDEAYFTYKYTLKNIKYSKNQEEKLYNSFEIFKLLLEQYYYNDIDIFDRKNSNIIGYICQCDDEDTLKYIIDFYIKNNIKFQYVKVSNQLKYRNEFSYVIYNDDKDILIPYKNSKIYNLLEKDWAKNGKYNNIKSTIITKAIRYGPHVHLSEIESILDECIGENLFEF